MSAMLINISLFRIDRFFVSPFRKGRRRIVPRVDMKYVIDADGIHNSFRSISLYIPEAQKQAMNNANNVPAIDDAKNYEVRRRCGEKRSLR